MGGLGLRLEERRFSERRVNPGTIPFGEAVPRFSDSLDADEVSSFSLERSLNSTPVNSASPSIKIWLT